MPASPPHPLDLYRLAVQHPLAEVAFIERAWTHFHGEEYGPWLLREDFAGTSAIAAAWCASDPDRQAMAVERDLPTVNWATNRFAATEDLHLVHADVIAVDGPPVDVTLALNFSILIYHDRPTLLGYLALARQSLNPGGLLILDLFGGKQVDQPSDQTRVIEPDEGGFSPFTYRWEQGPIDPKTRRIVCRIHFELGDGTRLDDAFVYDWRLWKTEELLDAAEQAGFAEASLWWAPPESGKHFVPIAGEPPEDAWVAYLVCRAAGEPD